ncbi:MAG: hypothetical protein WEC73_03675 [Chthoniobacterales bacterium]
MKFRWIAAVGCLGLTLATGPGQTVAPELLKPENRTVSSSKRFTVFGGTRQERSDLARRAEDLRDGVRRELGKADDGRDPILLVVTPGEALRLRQPRVFVQVFDAGDAGQKIEVNIAPAALADSAAVDAGILRALLLATSLQKQKFAGGRFVDPPWWLVSAMSAVMGRGEAGRDAPVYAALLEGKGMPRLDRFLRQNGEALQGRARDIYAAQSYALYLALSEPTGGKSRIAENLMLAEPPRDPMERFERTWPDLAAEPERAARIWALSVARLAAPERVEFLSAAESGRRLAAALTSLEDRDSSEDPTTVMLEMARTSEGRFRLEQAAAELRRLGFRAHPLYASLVEEYRVLVDELSRKKRRGFAAKFGEAEDLRWALDERSTEITDFLNWYQANAPEAQPVVRVARVLRPEPPVRRNDAISRFLDSVEQRGW